MNNQQKINAWFQNFEQRFDKRVPALIAREAVNYYKNSFIIKSWEGKAWAPTKKKVGRGSLLLRSAGGLHSTIRPKTITPQQITISAGNSRIPYARVHNEGGLVTLPARSETFQRNRVLKPKKGQSLGQFKKGTTAGRGFTFKASSFNMPKRQFMGHTAQLNKQIIQTIRKELFT